MLVAPDSLRFSAVIAATENGTSCSDVSRFCAVTMISSLMSSSFGVSCA
jgi:hypothetical protein